MEHLSESQLILHYYGEGEDGMDAAAHLGECAACRESYLALERVLGAVAALEVPEPAASYESALWAKIAPQLRPPVRAWLWGWRLAAGAACAALLAAALLTGPLHHPKPQPVLVADNQAGERVLRVAVGDYLDRSQLVLLELANTDRSGEVPWSSARDRASDLLSESRLYRQTAEQTGDLAVAHVLDELDRVLLDVAHGPDQLSPGDLARFQQRLDSQGILFKIRVLSSNMQKQS